MIYCNLQGGLGNMFFQVATAISFAHDLEVEPSFPNLSQHLKYLNDDNKHNPGLKHSFSYEAVLKGLSTKQPEIGLPVFKFPFHYIMTDITNNCIIDGFFQSENYFAHNRQVVGNRLCAPEHINKEIETKHGHRLKGKTTSIHVRRGDYVNHPNHHPVQTIEYYQKSIELVKDKTDTFLIFSDDIEWCKNNLNIDNSIYIEKERDYIELYLMAKCDNNIIANSSFSWWGAWLNTNKEKVVIGPKKWFGTAINESSEDILPDSWIKI